MFVFWSGICSRPSVFTTGVFHAFVIPLTCAVHWRLERLELIVRYVAPQIDDALDRAALTERTSVPLFRPHMSGNGRHQYFGLG